jgi:hypothetical protein
MEQRAPPSRENEQQNDRGGYNSESEMRIDIWNERTNTIHIDPRACLVDDQRACFVPTKRSEGRKGD